MTLRQAAFRAAAATVVVLAAAVVPVGDPPETRAAAQTHIAIIGDSYTTGSDEGVNGAQSWPELAWQLLARRGVEIDADVAAEGGAGYGQRGNGGSVFEDLTAQALRRNDVLVVFFGSRNDEAVDPAMFPDFAAGTFQLARFAAPAAKFLVIGPPWPTASPPPSVPKIRDSLRQQAAAGAVLDQPDLIGRDGVHPTDAGHSYMAQRIAPLIYDQLMIRI